MKIRQEKSKLSNHLITTLAILLSLNLFACGVHASSGEEIIRAAEAGNAKEVGRLLAKGEDINVKDKNGETLFHVAARTGLKAYQSRILAMGAELHARRSGKAVPGNKAQSTPPVRDHADVAKLLIARGADVNAKDAHGATPLHLGAIFGHAVTRRLIEKGAVVNITDDSGDSPLHFAASIGNKRVAALLIARGADINLKNNDGYSPLFVAIAMGNQAIAELLVGKGADIRATANDGSTHLHAAVLSGKKAIANLLIARGIDPNTAAKNGRTPLHLAISMGDSPMAELLLAKGAHVDPKDDAGVTPLHLAAHGKAAALLIAKGADIQATCEIEGIKNATPLHIAASKGHLDVVELLIAKGAQINAKSEGGRTPLSYAQENKHEAVTRLLLKHGGETDQ